MISDFKYSTTEVTCSDLKIIFITDEKAVECGHTDIHMHSFWELFYIKEGTFSINTETEKCILKESEMMIIPPDTYHSTESSSDVVKISVFFTFEKIKAADEEKVFDRIYPAFMNVDFKSYGDCNYIGMLIDSILTNLEAASLSAKWHLKANVTELVFSVYDRIINESNVSSETALKQNNYWAYKYAIDRLLDIYYTNDISLDFLSEKLFTSPQNITRIISAAYGKSFNELKLELKMRNAKKMLRETNLSVGEIGVKSGYTTTRGFLSAFLKYEGCTPSEYRKSFK